MAAAFGGRPPRPSRRQYHFPPSIISSIYKAYLARYPGDTRCSSRFARVSRVWAHEVEKRTFRRLVVDVSAVSTTTAHPMNNSNAHHRGSLYMGTPYSGPWGEDNLAKLEAYVRGPRRAFLRELVFILPDPMRDVDACNAAMRRLFDVLGGWGLPQPMQRAYVDLEIFITDEYADLHHNRPLGSVFVFKAGDGRHQQPFSPADASPTRSLRPGPLPLHHVKGLVFGRGRRYVQADAWRAQLCPYLADSLLGVNNSTFVVGDNMTLLPVNDWLHGWFRRMGVDSRSKEC
ncbi:uncharacterized protein PG986_000486 [Apiospora aurea]|uniref:Uncharacterized protein n=1 Tax=Apiospora aurea TaxID=335848 RepID=A0ABR1QUD2_9PEZI